MLCSVFVCTHVYAAHYWLQLSLWSSGRLITLIFMCQASSPAKNTSQALVHLQSGLVTSRSSALQEIKWMVVQLYLFDFDIQHIPVVIARDIMHGFKTCAMLNLHVRDAGLIK